MSIVKRPDGKIEVNGQVYAVAEGAVASGLPGCPINIVLEQLTPRRNYTSLGFLDGDIRPKGGGPALLGVGRIQGD